MKAGRELDALVAEKVMGWEWRPWAGNREQSVLTQTIEQAESRRLWGRNVLRFVPHYSTDIAAAWGVMDYMLEQDDQQLFLRFAHAVRNAPEGDLVARGYTAAHRICLAALRAVGVDL